MKRRSFLKFMGVAPAAAKQAATATLSQAGLSVGGALPAAMTGVNAMSDLEAAVASPDARNMLGVMRNFAKKFTKRNQLPAFKESEVRRRAEQYTGIDADLASMVSMSPSYKIRKQSELNIIKCRQHMIVDITHHAERRAWNEKMEKENGFYPDWY